MMPTITTVKTVAAPRFEHAKRCKHHLDECVVCKGNIEFFGQLPPRVLNEALIDSPVKRANERSRFTFGSVALERLIERTTHNVRGSKDNPHQTPRAAADVKMNFSLFGSLQRRGVKF